MNQFIPRWSDWSPEMANPATDRTDKSLPESAEVPRPGTDKTDKSPSVSFVSSKPGRSEENTPAIPPIPGADQVGGMKLTDFARAGLIVQVRSQVLDADVLFVSDNVPESRIKGLPEVVYRAHELKKLARVPPDPRGLRTVHMVKEIYGGTIQDVADRRDHSEVRDATEG